MEMSYLNFYIRAGRVRHRHHSYRHPNPEAVSDGHTQEKQQHLQMPDSEGTWKRIILDYLHATKLFNYIVTSACGVMCYSYWSIILYIIFVHNSEMFHKFTFFFLRA